MSNIERFLQGPDSDDGATDSRPWTARLKLSGDPFARMLLGATGLVWGNGQAEPVWGAPPVSVGPAPTGADQASELQALIVRTAAAGAAVAWLLPGQYTINSNLVLGDVILVGYNVTWNLGPGVTEPEVLAPFSGLPAAIDPGWEGIIEVEASGGDDTTAILAAMATAKAAGGGTVRLDADGLYTISATLLVDNASRVIIMGGANTKLVATAALAGQPVIEFRNSRMCGVRDLWIYGESGGNCPSDGVLSSSTASATQTATGLRLHNVRFGSDSTAPTLVTGIRYNCEGSLAGAYDLNNDMGVFSECLWSNVTRAIDIRGVNSLLHTVIAPQIGSGVTYGIRFEGGSATVLGGIIGLNEPTGDGSNPLLEWLAADYYHASHFVGVAAEFPGSPYIKADAGASGLIVTLDGCTFPSGWRSHDGQNAIVWACPGTFASQLIIDKCTMDVGYANITCLQSHETGRIKIRDSKLGFTEFRYAGELHLQGNVMMPGVVTYTDISAAGDGMLVGPTHYDEAVFAQTGVLSTGTGSFRYYVTKPYTRIEVDAWVAQAPTGAAVIVDVNKNGTSLFTTQANRPTIGVGAFTSTRTLPNTQVISAGQYLTVDVDQVGSTIPGSDLGVRIRLYR